MLGRPPQCCPNGATLVPSQQAHLCKPSPTVLVARLFQGCPGAIIPVKSSQGSSSATIPARPSQGCAAATIPARPSLVPKGDLSAVPGKPVPVDHAGAIPVRTLPVMPAAAPSQQCHPGAITTRLILIHTAGLSQRHHPSEASPCCPGEVNPGAVSTRPSQCQPCMASTSAIIPVKRSRCHHPGKTIPMLFQ